MIAKSQELYYISGYLLAKSGWLTASKKDFEWSIALESADAHFILNSSEIFIMIDGKLVIKEEYRKDILEISDRNKIYQLLNSSCLIDFLRGIFDAVGVIYPTDFGFHIKLYEKLTTEAEILYKTIFNGFGDLDIQIRGGIGYLDDVQAPLFLKSAYSTKSICLPSKYEQFLEISRLTMREALMEMAFTLAKRSTCLRTKVGSVVTSADGKNIVAIGYNGQKSGEQNHCQSLYPGKCGCIHAEINAIEKASGDILYCTTLPCTNCALEIINKKAFREVCYSSYYRNSDSLKMFADNGIECFRVDRTQYCWKLECVPEPMNNTG